MGFEGAKGGTVGEGVALAALLAEATARLAAAGVEAPAREARLLLAHALGLPLGGLLALARDAKVPAAGFRSLLARRAEERVPLAFLVGTRGFWTLDLRVSPATLVPRADTETLVEAALALRPDRASIRRILDLGTGTGALLLASLTEYPGAFGVGVDRVAEAARLARDNAQRAALAPRAAFVCGDWGAALADACFDLVFCNPPYIESGAVPELMPEVARHEPTSALDGGPDGLDAYRALVPQLARLMAPGGLAVLELGAGQAPAVEAIAGAAGLARAALRPDLSGTARALALERVAAPPS